MAAAPARTVDSANCTVIAGPGAPITTVAIGEAVDPAHAPRPTNDGERLVFRQIYETLVRADCEGHVGPGLAIAWRLDADPRTWTLTLRDNARFSDGTPVTAAGVRASWSVDGGRELRPDVRRLVESIVSIDDRTVSVKLRRQDTDAPIVLAHADLAIAKGGAGSSWPLGTRSDRAAPQRTAAGAPGALLTIERENHPPIRFLAAQGDPRDVLDKGVDLLLTRDATALAYADTLPGFQSASSGLATHARPALGRTLAHGRPAVRGGAARVRP